MAAATVRHHRRVLRFLPIVGRELRIAARGFGTYRWRTLVTATALGFMAILTTTETIRNVPVSVQGASLFESLILVSCVYAFLSSVSATADAVSREKREGTLGLLFLTDLRGADIILGKLAANSLNAIYGLLALLPLLAIPVLMGGISIASGISAALAIMNLLFVSLCLGVFISTLSWDERRATFAVFVAGLVVLFAPIGLATFLGPEGWVLARFSPLFTFFQDRAGPGSSWSPTVLVPSHLIGWLFLVPACRMVQDVWQSRSGGPVRRTLDERLFMPGHPRARAKHRRQLLNEHPLVWLMERHRGKRFYADGLVLSIMTIWLFGYRSYGWDMFGGPGWYLVAPLAFTVHLILASWVVSESSMRLLEDRRSGALELLLCTSLTDRDFLRGHRLALRRLFLRPVLILAVAEVLVAFWGFGSDNDVGTSKGRWMMLAMAAAVAMDTHALSWISLRLAAGLPTVTRVEILALAITPFGPILVTSLVVSVLLLYEGPGAIRFFRVLGIWISTVAFLNLVVAQWICRGSVIRRFRELAVRMPTRAAAGAE